MGTRLELQTLLEDIAESQNVYFQPPESLRMQYPAIVYSLNRIENHHANNSVYFQNNSYQITVIDKDPDSELVRKLSRLPMCRHDRSYSAENLYHCVFTIYF